MSFPIIFSTQYSQLFQSYSICSSILLVKYIFAQVYGANLQNHPQEDEKLMKITVPEDMKRRERIFANDMENIPFDMVIFWGALLIQIYAITSGRANSETIALICFIAIYTACRVLFTIFYIFALQPYRSLAWGLGRLSVLGAAFVMVSSSFKYGL